MHACIQGQAGKPLQPCRLTKQLRQPRSLLTHPLVVISLLHRQMRAMPVHRVPEGSQECFRAARSLYGCYKLGAAAGESQQGAVGVAGGSQAVA